MLDNALTDFVCLYVVIDPIGTVPIFLSVTGQSEPALARRIAWESILVGGGVLLGFLILGQVILHAMHVSMDSFQVAGGIVLFLFAMTMVFGIEHSGASNISPRNNPAVFPLAMPAIAGPGAILAVVVLTDNERYNYLHQARTAGVLLVVLFVQWILLRAAGPIQSRLGHSGTNILSRVMGLILAGVSVETVAAGIRGMMKHG